MGREDWVIVTTTTFVVQIRSGSTWGKPAGKHKFKTRTKARKDKRLRNMAYPECEYRIVKRTEEVVG